jgi:hypothetical protein
MIQSVVTYRNSHLRQLQEMGPKNADITLSKRQQIRASTCQNVLTQPARPQPQVQPNSPNKTACTVYGCYGCFGHDLNRCAMSKPWYYIVLHGTVGQHNFWSTLLRIQLLYTAGMLTIHSWYANPPQLTQQLHLVVPQPPLLTTSARAAALCAANHPLLQLLHYILPQLVPSYFRRCAGMACLPPW